MTGAVLVSIGVGLAMVVCGLLAYRGALRSFSRDHSDAKRKRGKRS